MKHYEILLMDEDPCLLKLNASALGHRGYQVTTTSSGDVAIETLHVKKFDLVITE